MVARMTSCGLLVLVMLSGCPGDAVYLELDNGTYHYDGGLRLVDGDPPDNSAEDGRPDVGEHGSSPSDTQPDRKPDLKPDAPPDLPTPTGGDIGDPCAGYSSCKSKICAVNAHTGQGFCTKQCDPCATQPCPDGTGCQNIGPAVICVPGYPDAPCGS